MKLYSWNVNGIRAVIKKGALQQFLEEQHPDILCLQEIKAKPEQVDFDFPSYRVFWNPAKRLGYSGTATLVSRECVKLTNFSKWNNSFWEDDGSREAEVANNEGRVLVVDCDKFYLVNVYTPNSKPDLSRLKFREKEWDSGFLSLLKELEKEKPVVTCGDFNAVHREIDIARPKTNHHTAGFTDEERQGITNLISAGFIDSFRTLHPEAVRYTWWSHWGQARANNVGWRIDYFFVSKALKFNLKSAEIYEDYMGSDHCPISINLEF